VAVLEGAKSISSTRPAFAIVAAGQPAFAFDGDPTTGWFTGYFGTALHQRISIELSFPQRVSSLTLRPVLSDPVEIAAIKITAGDQTVVRELPRQPEVIVQLPPTTTDHLTIEIERTRGTGLNSVGFWEIEVPGVHTSRIARMPTTFARLARELDAQDLQGLAATPLDIIMSSQDGNLVSLADDEERALDRTFELPQARAFSFDATALHPRYLPASILDDLEASDGTPSAADNFPGCTEVATIDGVPVLARLLATEADVRADRTVALEPCDDAPIQLAEGTHRLRSTIGWLLGRVRLTSTGTAATPEGVAPTVEVTTHSSTHIRLTTGPAAGAYYLVAGQGYDPRWRATVDGEKLGSPVLLDGYAVAWRIDDPGPHEIEITFGPQTVVRASFLLSGLAILLVLALWVPRRRLAGWRRARRHP
jgi:hypothetical protein